MPEPISKTEFTAGVQCLKRLYLLVRRPEPTSGALDADVLATMEQGKEVGILARELFPGGVEVGAQNREQAIRVTRELVANEHIPAIFEGAFEADGVFVRVDILVRGQDKRWTLIEVKSSTGAKDEHIPDVAIQSYVVARSGLDIAISSLTHVNREYVLHGSIEPQKFFSSENVNANLQEFKPKLAEQLRTSLHVLAEPNPPDIAPGRHCTKPHTCEFFDSCNLPLPADHVSYLPNMHESKLSKLADSGISSIHAIPEDFPLTEKQRHAHTSVSKGKPWVGSGLRAQLRTLQYPISFMDFECLNPAIPRFNGMRPYEQIPFQWSLHRLADPVATLEHYEYLATDREDPRLEFITSLCASLGSVGSIVVYSASFESQRITQLATWFPQFAEQIDNIQKRLWDLLTVVRDHVYHPKFAGSFSLKSVLPAFAPEMTYEGMAVADGRAAGRAWDALIGGRWTEADSEITRRALLDYCGQDTLAMVRLLQMLPFGLSSRQSIEQSNVLTQTCGSHLGLSIDGRPDRANLG